MSNYFKNNNVKCPADTAELPINEIDNFYLKLNKAAKIENNKFTIYINDKKNKKYFEMKPDYTKVSIDKIRRRFNNNMKVLKELGYTILKVQFFPDEKLIIGIGGASVYETSITLHYIYGIPVIPGQTIKGVLRNWFINEIFGYNEQKIDLNSAEKRALNNKIFCDIFGCNESSFYNESREGKVLFFDAIPSVNDAKKINISPDIINCHYNPYYTDSTNLIPPADCYTPNPVIFLTIKDTPFEFYIAIKNEIENDNKNYSEHKKIFDFIGTNPSIIDIVKECINNVIINNGIGAKTSVGYGYGKNVKIDIVE